MNNFTQSSLKNPALLLLLLLPAVSILAGTGSRRDTNWLSVITITLLLVTVAISALIRYLHRRKEARKLLEQHSSPEL